MALELGVLAVFCIAVLVEGGHEGLSLTSFLGLHLPDRRLGQRLCSDLHVRLSVSSKQRSTARRSSIPSATVSRATYTAVIVLAVVYSFCAWVIVAGLLDRVGWSTSSAVIPRS